MKTIKYCNMCGKEFREKQEEYLHVEKEWGYFSQKDQAIYRFHICEACFHHLINRFAIPAEMDKQTELL